MPKYNFTTGQNAATATELVYSLFADIDARIHPIKYPALKWRDAVPAGAISEDMNPAAIEHVYTTSDVQGVGEFTKPGGRNIPLVTQTHGQVRIPIREGSIGAVLMDAEARRYNMGFNTSLAADYAKVMKGACEYHVERSLFFGDRPNGFMPFLDYPLCARHLVDAWTGEDPEPWINSLNQAMTDQWMLSKQTFLTSHIKLPPMKIAMLTRAMKVGSLGVALTALDWFKKNNLYTAETGNELTITSLRYLEGAGVGSDNTTPVDRAVLMDFNEDYFLFPFPQPCTVSPQPVPIPLGTEIYATWVIGSFHVRQPLAMAYVDGI